MTDTIVRKRTVYVAPGRVPPGRVPPAPSAPPASKRYIVQMFTTKDGYDGALANDGTTWWWNGSILGWRPLYDEVPQG